MTNENYDVSSYNRPNYVCEELVKELGRECVIVSAGGFREAEDKDGNTYKRAYVLVEFPTAQGEQFQYSFSRKISNNLTEEIGSTDMRKWVGKILKLIPQQAGKTTYYGATVIQSFTTKNDDVVDAVTEEEASTLDELDDIEFEEPDEDIVLEDDEEEVVDTQ